MKPAPCSHVLGGRAFTPSSGTAGLCHMTANVNTRQACFNPNVYLITRCDLGRELYFNIWSTEIAILESFYVLCSGIIAFNWILTKEHYSVFLVKIGQYLTKFSIKEILSCRGLSLRENTHTLSQWRHIYDLGQQGLRKYRGFPTRGPV